MTLSKLKEHIEFERSELMQVQAVLRCLHEVLQYADDNDSVMHADVAGIAARLIQDCAERLEKLKAGCDAPVYPTKGDHNEEKRIIAVWQLSIADRSAASSSGS